ncbi:MAG: cytochrome c1 [Alphaproteobacteria bacterium]|nr:cytochrome c1 [Alphaproteobacteria bacterium]
MNLYKILYKNLTVVIFSIFFLTPHLKAEEEHISLPKQDWSFKKPWGAFDRAAQQRGFAVYKEVCSTCHSMSLIAYRNLRDIGLSEDAIKAIASQYQIGDGPNDEGEMFERPGLPSDKFKNPYSNEKAARAANNGAYPPDLSLIIKARPEGADYIYNLLTGYDKAPTDVKIQEGMYYNKYFTGHNIAMPPPLTTDGQVTYADETPATVQQMAKDVVTFLAWAAEPELEVRHRTGIKTITFLIVLSVLLYFVNRKIWAKIKH